MSVTHTRYRPSLARHMLEGYLAWYATVQDAEKCYIIANLDIWKDAPEILIKRSSGNGVILDISPQATRDLNLGDEALSFSARFSGETHVLEIPWAALHSVYAITRGQEAISQVGFSGYSPDEFKRIETVEEPIAQPAGQKPALRIVK